jgi:hypothetical protein
MDKAQDKRTMAAGCSMLTNQQKQSAKDVSGAD